MAAREEGGGPRLGPPIRLMTGRPKTLAPPSGDVRTQCGHAVFAPCGAHAVVPMDVTLDVPMDVLTPQRGIGANGDIPTGGKAVADPSGPTCVDAVAL